MIKRFTPSPSSKNDEFAILQKKVKFGQRALLITVIVLLGLLLITGNFIEKTDENCERYNNCQDR
jgi:hypothetical protein